ncbi:MAG: 23S rRNA (adenine(2030)-N(6))-methyltransferase RlmJ [Saccharospirillaceae bacterium]|nr:23S rRNA (adenine(2030)-N(6))-methyltransferase RlmJ [Pseudomonadales bacterium]NRB79019.1 23S rRNA (adenine(2030)-N(6))-methyltransferase RlmJ [Saccharospirillaceae bacterium]
MLSYRHSFHAGNYADVLKHIVCVEIFEHMLKKDKPFEYIDTHSGAGLYSFHSSHAQKLKEHDAGISLISPKAFPELKSYFDVIQLAQKKGVEHKDDLSKLAFYPGSPWIAKQFLRRNDRSWLFELHPEDFKLLSKNIPTSKFSRVQKEDGFQGLKAIMPPTSKRAFVLMDPSYEVKSEYDQVVKSIAQAYHKFKSGTYAIWYPVVERAWINRMESQLKSAGVRNIQRFELAVNTDDSQSGMNASGMIVINAPWTLFKKMEMVLPKLAKVVGQDGKGGFKCDVIVVE